MKTILLYLFILIGINLSAQNLVQNGSFIDYYKCPDNRAQLHYAKNWFGLDGRGGSCEYFNACFKKHYPENVFGTQYARTSHEYIGVSYYESNVEYKEFPMNHLSMATVNGIYIIRFFVSLADSSSYAIRNIGIYLSKDTLTVDQLSADTIQPFWVPNNDYLINTSKWVELSGEFYNNGGDIIITIGNFNIYRFTDTIKVNNAHFDYAYYYIDDVALYLKNAPIAIAQCIADTQICKRSGITVGLTQIEQQYKSEYEHIWYIANHEKDTLSTEQFPVFYPDTTTTYVLKLTDFKYDITYDTVVVKVVDCALPTHLKVFPNPSHNKVSFKFNSSIPENMKIELYNLLGQRIKSVNFPQNYHSNSVELNLNTLANGIYFYSVIIEGKPEFSGKLIKI